MDANRLPKTVTRQRRDCDMNPGPTAPESSTLTTRLPSHPNKQTANEQLKKWCVLYLVLLDLLEDAVDEFAGVFEGGDGLFGGADPVWVSRHHRLKVTHVCHVLVHLVLKQPDAHVWNIRITGIPTDEQHCRMTNYELLRWLVETPSRDVEHYNMSTASRSPCLTL